MENEKREETVTVTAMPANIKTASYLIYASVTVSMASILLFEKVDGLPIYVGAFITLLLWSLLGYKVGQGESWARTTFMVLTVIGFAFSLFYKNGEFEQSLGYGLSSTLATVLDLLVLVMLYTGEANRWYKENRLEQHS
jgi:uncharacterized membrane protein